MTYSRKRYWFALGVALAVAAAFLALGPQLRPALIDPWMIQLAVVAICGALGFLAYFSLDEIQRQNEERAWYYGGLLAILVGLVPFLLLVSNSTLEAMADFLSNAFQAEPDTNSPRDYFRMGVAMTVLVQGAGYFIAHTIFKITGRARR